MSGLPFGRRCFQLRRFNPTYGTYAVRLETAPTGSGENIELPNYFLKPHTDCGPRDYFQEICFTKRNFPTQAPPIAPLGLGELVLPMYYTPIAPLGLNASNALLRLTCCPDSSGPFNSENPDSDNNYEHPSLR